MNGAIPTTWDRGWQFYTDLSDAQISAFQAMPQWVAYLSAYQEWLGTMTGPPPSL